jgi:hypothetical protein
MGRITNLLNEEISREILTKLERALDKLYAKIGMDVEFTRHFHDRLNDPRNRQPITIKELIKIFDDTFKKHGKKIAKFPASAEAVLKDLESDVNVPFVIKYSHAKQKIELITKTIMRKKNFQSSSPVLKV